MKRKSKALKEAIAAVGGLKPISRALKISTQAVSQWHEAPANRVLALEKISGISRYALRPDIFGDAPGDLPIAGI